MWKILKVFQYIDAIIEQNEGDKMNKCKGNCKCRCPYKKIKRKIAKLFNWFDAVIRQF